MTTRSARRTTRPQSRVEQASRAGLIAWARFTFAGDTNRLRVAPIPHVAVNWLAVALLGLGWGRAWDSQWRLLGAATVLGLLYTVVRAGRWLPANRKTLDAIYATTQATCGHPKGTSSNPPNPATRIKMTWAAPKKPALFTIAVAPNSTAAKPADRWQVEKDLEGLLGDDTHDVIFTHAHGAITVERVPLDDPRIQQKHTRRWVENTIAQLFPEKRTTPVATECEFTDDPDTPAQVTVTFGAYDVSSRDFRSKTERGFDAQVARAGIEWVYDWTQPGVLTITATPKDASAAVRKRVARKVGDVVIGALTRATSRTATAQAEAEVIRWVPVGKPKADTPTRVLISLGTADYSSLRVQQQVELKIDQALEAEWPDRVWLADWSAADATLTLSAVPKGHVQALRKAEERRMRQVVDTKFRVGTTGIPTNVEVHEWDEAKPVRLTVTFGTVDVTKPDVRREFEAHFDSLTEDNDWRYDWKPTEGHVAVEAVPALPRYVAFPDEGSTDAEAWHEKFRNGVIFLGPAKGGYRTEINLNKVPHTLIGGNTGSGKSVALMLPVYGSLMNPDYCDLIMVDPKITDFPWLADFPNVLAFQPTDARCAQQQINQAVSLAHDSLLDRQQLLNAFGAKNLRTLRRLAAEGKIDLKPEDIPKRLFLFYDEIALAFTPASNEDDRALQEHSKTMMIAIHQIGRSNEVNAVSVAQKPGGDNIGTQMRELMGNMVGIGPMKENMSRQILGNTLGTLLPKGSPLGRGWFVDELGRELLFQTMYLPEQEEPAPWNDEIRLQGVQERVDARLRTLGWVPVKVPRTFHRQTKSGIEEFSTVVTDWVRPDRIDTTKHDEAS